MNGTKDIGIIYYYCMWYIKIIKYNVWCTGCTKKNGEKIVSSSSRNLFDLSTGLPINIYTVYDSDSYSIIYNNMYNVHNIIYIYIIRPRPAFCTQPWSSSFRPDFDRVFVIVHSLFYSISTQYTLYHGRCSRQMSILIYIIRLMSVWYAQKWEQLQKHNIIKNCNLQRTN